MNCTYFFKIRKPDNKISLIIDQYDDYGKLLYASQDGNRIDLNNKNLILYILGLKQDYFCNLKNKWD